MRDQILKSFLQYRGELFGFIRAIVRNTHDAEDLFQEIAAIIMEKSEQEKEIRNFRAWSKEIARRHVLAFFRKKKTRKNRYLPGDEMAELIADLHTRHSPGKEVLTREYDALRRCMQQLSGWKKQLIQLRFMEDKSFRQIALTVSRKQTAVRKSLYRIRLALVDCVDRKLGRAPGQEVAG